MVWTPTPLQYKLLNYMVSTGDWWCDEWPADEIGAILCHGGSEKDCKGFAGILGGHVTTSYGIGKIGDHPRGSHIWNADHKDVEKYLIWLRWKIQQLPEDWFRKLDPINRALNAIEARRAYNKHRQG